MKTIRWGIIGCGDVTEVKSGPGFQKAENSALVAVMRRNGDLAKDYAERHNVPLEISPLMVKIFKDGEARYGPRELSPNIIKRLEDAMGFKVLADGFPAEMLDDEPEEPGYEVVPKNRL